MEPAYVTVPPIVLAQAPGTMATHALTTTRPTPPAASQSSEQGPTPRTFFVLSLAALVVIALLAIIGTRKMRDVPRGLQNALEFVYESLCSIPEMVMGPRGRRYVPFVSTFFLYIVVMNFMGLIPFLKSGTASLSVTLGLAIVAFCAVQYFGFQAQGMHYLKHFMGPVPALAFLILPLELVSEFVRPVSLSVRLYGNIYGEEKVIAVLAHLHPLAAVIMLPLQLLTIFLQAFVFTLLVTVYIALATEHEEEVHAENSEATVHSR
jgi:F-type H+-transporting ATPase subunit a